MISSLSGRNKNGALYSKIDQLITLCIHLKRDFIKYQYGESPIKNEYIWTPFEYISEKIKKEQKTIAIFITDGGPRKEVWHYNSVE